MKSFKVSQPKLFDAFRGTKQKKKKSYQNFSEPKFFFLKTQIFGLLVGNVLATNGVQ